MLSKLTSIVLFISFGLLQPLTSPGQTGWVKVNNGLYKKTYTIKNHRSVAYHATTLAGRQALHRLLASRKPDALIALARLEQRSPKFVRAGTGTCSLSGYGNIGGSLEVDMSVTCSAGANINATITIAPPLNTFNGYQIYYYTGTGSLTENIFQACTPDPNFGGCGASFDPDDWATEEEYLADGTDEGYLCQSGPTYPYACPF
jgi:hypothetical protein